MLTRAFYQKPTLDVAKSLLGKKIIRQLGNTRYVAKIVETEAYIGENDSACHASKGLTPRTKVMFGPAGHAYVYFVYGMHYMFNIVTEQEDYPAAVLIRAVEPLENIEGMIANRKGQSRHIADGPAKLCQALQIDKQLNGQDLCTATNLWLEESNIIEDSKIIAKPRIGIDYADAKDREACWRFYIQNNKFISRA